MTNVAALRNGALRRRASADATVGYRRSHEACIHLSRLSFVVSASMMRTKYLDLRRQQVMGRRFRPSRFRGGYCATVEDLLAIVKNDMRSCLNVARQMREAGPRVRFLP